jgi:hypothetical protein
VAALLLDQELKRTVARYLFPGSRGGRALSTNALEIALKGLGYRDQQVSFSYLF